MGRAPIFSSARLVTLLKSGSKKNPQKQNLIRKTATRSSSSFVQPGLPDGTYIFKPKIRLWVIFGGS
jgi:hypothetical protein